MPKIIKNIEEKILSASSDLFIEQGYDKTDIRQIAKKAGIAVGTLYNYYKNKQDLFYAVFYNRLKETLDNINEAVYKAKTPTQRVYNFLDIMADEIQGNSKQGWKHIYRVYSQKKGFFDDPENIHTDIKEIFQQLESTVQKLYNDYSYELTGEPLPEVLSVRMKPTIMMMLFSLTNRLPQEKKENVKYIHSIVTCMCKMGRDYEEKDNNRN